MQHAWSGSQISVAGGVAFRDIDNFFVSFEVLLELQTSFVQLCYFKQRGKCLYELHVKHSLGHLALISTL